MTNPLYGKPGPEEYDIIAEKKLGANERIQVMIGVHRETSQYIIGFSIGDDVVAFDVPEFREITAFAFSELEHAVWPKPESG